ncbi:hypothetical protein DFA_07876 [Cavenderia fasciculata]|uniref:F-box domain-containing protein n=1 Tax=Cavenderia fasciculata TaxID=261658 RepID=F4Q3S9_CACFS|nr:uncharacterized protein DFA_07876 [Cavenderia fasciculata]EGG16895.1 hypothetical protein DFA_07876 [Cavenderia fasciculata]|eukprot:XP_004355369.1 hypothetical protein DFA_07876 [Cavenderia fasciculata]
MQYRNIYLRIESKATSNDFNYDVSSESVKESSFINFHSFTHTSYSFCMSLSLSLSLPNLPWTIQSEIIYIVCNYRNNQDQREIKSRDVYHVAGVSRRWRQLTTVSLTLNYKVNIDIKSLKEYRQHYENNLCLLSGPNHNIIASDITEICYETKEYIETHYEWFKEHIINKMSSFCQIGVGRQLLNIFKGQQVASLKKLASYYECVVPLELCHYLEMADLHFYRSSCKEICAILSICRQLKSLHINITYCPDIDTGISNVFSSMPRGLTKLVWGDKDGNSYSNSDQPFPFHLLPTTIQKLCIWDVRQTSTQAYYDYVLANSSAIQSLFQHCHPTQKFRDFLSSPLSRVKYLCLAGFPSSIFGKALIPPLVEVLRLDFNVESTLVAHHLECIFKYSVPLPNLHTIQIKRFNEVADSLLSFIQDSNSLRVIDLDPISFNNVDLVLDAVSNSPSVERVYLRHSKGKPYLATINSHPAIKNNQLSYCSTNYYDFIIFNIKNTSQLDLSSYHIIPK